MNRLVAILTLLAAAGAASASDPYDVEFDAIGDAVPRRTDPGADDAVPAAATLPDLISVGLAKWLPTVAVTGDPFEGTSSHNGPNLFRLDLVFAGLVNPPGPLSPYSGGAPFAYGPSPLYGFVEINIDRRGSNGGRDTGGDLTIEASSRYLANVGRFGGLPSGSMGLRAITRPGQFDFDFVTAPFFERSGAEFVFKLCGCEDFTILSTSTPGDTVFDAGDTWVIRGRFFERTSAFRGVSQITCPTPQQYAPLVNVRFSHDPLNDVTQVSMIYALDQEGARQLASLSTVPPLNNQVGCDGNQGSIQEAMADVIQGVAAAAANNWFGIDLPTRTMTQGWLGRMGALPQYLDPTDWRVTAIFGTTYATSASGTAGDGAEYIWTDALGIESGDQNGDEEVDALDRALIANYIAANDGGWQDADGLVNGSVTIPGFGVEFDVSDLNYDGRVDCLDLVRFAGSACCRADWNADGTLSVQDLFEFLFSWFAGRADFNQDGATSLQDLFDYLGQYLAGC